MLFIITRLIKSFLHAMCEFKPTKNISTNLNLDFVNLKDYGKLLFRVKSSCLGGDGSWEPYRREKNFGIEV